jgi:hypothetical protein
VSKRKMAAAIRNGRIKPPVADAPPPDAAPKRTIRHAAPACDPPKRIARCAVTGIPIHRGDVVHVIEVDRKIEDGPGEPQDREVFLPMAIDTRQPYPVDGGASTQEFLGALQWTREWRRWIGEETSTIIAEAQRAWDEWWTHPAIIDQLRLEMGNEKVDAALAIVRDSEYNTAVATRFNHSVHWVTLAVRRAQTIVRRKYLPPVPADEMAAFAERMRVEVYAHAG